MFEPAHKRARRDPNVDPMNPQPSAVIHIRNLNFKATEADLLEALQGFGRIAYATVMPNKRMALVEFETLEAATKCVYFAAEKMINIAGYPALFNFSTSPTIQRLGLECEVPNHVIVISISNVQYPITVNVIRDICAPHGDVLKIAIIRKACLQVLVQFDTIESARKAKYALNGADIYSGCCTLKVEFGRPETVKVTRNDETQFDYTRPDLDSNPNTVHFQPTRAPLIGGPMSNQMHPHPGASVHYDNQLPPFGYSDQQYTTPAPRNPGFADNYGRDHLEMPENTAIYPDYNKPPMMGRSLDPRAQNYYSEGDNNRQQSNDAFGGTTVLMIYGINHDSFNCDKLFNILCQYGNVDRIKFMHSKEDTVMVQMGHTFQVISALQFLQGAELFGCKLTLRPSKQWEVVLTGRGFDLPDQTPSFRDFSTSKHQRYTTQALAARNRACSPTKIIHWFNAPVCLDEQGIIDLFQNAGGPVPRSVRVNQARSEKSHSGTAEFATVVEATEALAIANHTPIQAPNFRLPFIVKMAFYAPAIPSNTARDEHFTQQ
ncbi:unnamed protein product, partial [Mesorhabditis spiculigera]